MPESDKQKKLEAGKKKLEKFRAKQKKGTLSQTASSESLESAATETSAPSALSSSESLSSPAPTSSFTLDAGPEPSFLRPLTTSAPSRDSGPAAARDSGPPVHIRTPETAPKPGASHLSPWSAPTSSTTILDAGPEPSFALPPAPDKYRSTSILPHDVHTSAPEVDTTPAPKPAPTTAEVPFVFTDAIFPSPFAHTSEGTADDQSNERSYKQPAAHSVGSGVQMPLGNGPERPEQSGVSASTVTGIGGSRTERGERPGVIAKWLTEREQRMKVVMAAAIEMEHAIASVSYSTKGDIKGSQLAADRSKHMHSLARTAHEVVLRLEGSGFKQAEDFDPLIFPAVNDIVSELRCFNTRNVASGNEDSGSLQEHVNGVEDAAGSETNERLAPNGGPEQPTPLISDQMTLDYSQFGLPSGQDKRDGEPAQPSWMESPFQVSDEMSASELRHMSQQSSGKELPFVKPAVNAAPGTLAGANGSKTAQPVATGDLAFHGQDAMVQQLMWENSSLLRRVEVQANALIEMSVEKERWVTDRAKVQNQEKSAQDRAKLMEEEKEQLKQSLQNVIESLLAENQALREQGALVEAQNLTRTHESNTELTSLGVAKDGESLHLAGSSADEKQGVPTGAGVAQSPAPSPPAMRHGIDAEEEEVASSEPCQQTVGQNQEHEPKHLEATALEAHAHHDLQQLQPENPPKELSNHALDVPKTPSRSETSPTELPSPQAGSTVEDIKLLLSPFPAPEGESPEPIRLHEHDGGENQVSGSVSSIDTAVHLPAESPGVDGVNDHAVEPALPTIREDKSLDTSARLVEQAAHRPPVVLEAATNGPTQPLSSQIRKAQKPPNRTVQGGAKEAPPPRPFPPELLAHPGDIDIQIDIRHLENFRQKTPEPGVVLSVLDTLWGVVSLRPVRTYILGGASPVGAEEFDPF